MSVIVDSPASGVTRIRLNRPEARNALNDDMRLGLLEALKAARADDAVRAILIGGMEGVLGAGGDLPSLAATGDRGYDAVFARMRSGHEVITTIWECPKPVVVAAERFAVGAAAGIALACDVVVAGPGTRFGFPFLQLGLSTDWGVSGSLRFRAGPSAAFRLLRECAMIKGEEAATLGLVDTLVADEDVMSAAIGIAVAESAKAAGAYARMKRLMRGEAEAALGLLAEAETQAHCVISPEFAEGFAAFREKRAPRFI